MTPKEVLEKYFGYKTFNDLQEEAINASLNNNDCLVILPTGGGKSLCFQIPALCSKKMTLVISPLIALMNDQVLAAKECGIKAAAMHSGNKEEGRQAYIDAINGNLDLLYISPERLALGDLFEQIKPHLGLIAIDEAHCISHWGHDFRPEYRKLASIFFSRKNIPIMALTATATPSVQNDICSELKLNNPIRLVGHMDRPNLLYRALPRTDSHKQIMSIIKKQSNNAGIIYAQTRKEVERIASKLVSEGVSAAAYHAGLSSEVRLDVQNDFIKERVAVVVATIAFGMGIDRSNVRFVIHVNAPKSIEQYQQESGRAGRDGMPAECVLLYKYSDIVLHQKLAEQGAPVSMKRKNILTKQLKEIIQFCTVPICRHKLLLQHFGQKSKNDVIQSCLACDVCLGETKQMALEEALPIAKKIISCVIDCNGKFGTMHVVDVLAGSKSAKIIKFGHDRFSSYGIMKTYGKAAIKQWIDQLIVQDFLQIRMSYSGFPILSITSCGYSLQQNIGSPKLTEVADDVLYRVETKKVKKYKSDLSNVDNYLFDQMRLLRKNIAIRIGKPPYIVFSDATLYELSSLKPSNLDDFLRIKGVARLKCDRYGPAFVKLISENCSVNEAMSEFV